MTDRINNGDREALKVLLSAYTRPVYERALMRTGNESAAKTVTRTTLNEIMAAASRGQCPENTETWIMELAERFSAEEVQLRGGTPAKVQPAPVQSAQSAPQQPVQSAPVQPADEGWTPPDFNTGWTPPDYITGWTPGDITSPSPVHAGHFERAEDPVSTQPDAVQLQEDFVSLRSETKSRSRKSGYYDDEDDELDLFDEDDEDEDEYPRRRRRKKAGFGMVLLILLLGVLVVALVWMLAVMLMSRGILPMADLGFAEWFNTNIFPLY